MCYKLAKVSTSDQITTDEWKTFFKYAITSLATIANFLLASGFGHPFSLSYPLVDPAAFSSAGLCSGRHTSVYQGLVFVACQGFEVE